MINESVKIIFLLIKSCKNFTKGFGKKKSDPQGLSITFFLKNNTAKIPINKFFDIE